MPPESKPRKRMIENTWSSNGPRIIARISRDMPAANLIVNAISEKGTNQDSNSSIGGQEQKRFLSP
jgi:hypothetical protein